MTTHHAADSPELHAAGGSGLVPTPWRKPALLGTVGATLTAVSGVLGDGTVPAGPAHLYSIFHGPLSQAESVVPTAGRVAGLLLWLAAWMAARSLPRRYLFRVAICWLVPLLLIPPGQGDVYNYVQQGWTVLHGGDPTTDPAGSLHGPYDAWAGWWKGTTVGYPPLALAIQAAMVYLSHGLNWLALLLMRLPGLVALALLWRRLPVVARRLGHDGQKVTWMALLNPITLWQGIYWSHMDLVGTAVALAAASYLFLPRNRETSKARSGALALGVVLLVAAAAIKPTCLIAACVALPSWLPATRFRSWRLRQVALAAACGAVIAVPAALVDLGSKALPFGRNWSHPSGDPSRHASSWYSTAIAWGQTQPTGFLGAFAHHAPAHAMFGCTAVAGVLVLILVVSRRLRSAAAIPAAAMLAICTIGPEGRSWYLIPVFLCLGLTHYRRADLVAVTVAILLGFTGETYQNSLVAQSYLERQIWGWFAALAFTACWLAFRDELPARSAADRSSDGR